MSRATVPPKVVIELSEQDAAHLAYALEKMRMLAWYAWRTMMDTTPRAAVEEVNTKYPEYIDLETKLHELLPAKKTGP